MPNWLSLDWHELFVPSKPILDTIIRGTVTYLALFAMLRFFRRQTGSIGTADLLVLLLIADAAQNAMAYEYKSITDGLLLVGTIIFWEYAIDRLSYSVRWFGKILEGEPLPLIEKGEVQSGNLSKSLITLDDLMSQLRQRGVEDVGSVKCCYLEGDGHISIIMPENAGPPLQPPSSRAETG